MKILNNRGFLDVKKSMTLAVWVYPLSGGPIVSYSDGSETQCGVQVFYTKTDRKLLIFKLVKRNNKFTTEIEVEMKDNQWSYIAATYDFASGKAALKVNDSRKEQFVGHFHLATNHAIMLGSVNNYHFAGRMFCFQIYKKALNKTQLARAKTCTKCLQV